MSIQLDLEIEEVNGVLVALGNMPYAQVQPLIDKVRSQALPQVQAQAEVPELTESEG